MFFFFSISSVRNSNILFLATKLHATVIIIILPTTYLTALVFAYEPSVAVFFCYYAVRNRHHAIPPYSPIFKEIQFLKNTTGNMAQGSPKNASVILTQMYTF